MGVWAVPWSPPASSLGPESQASRVVRCRPLGGRSGPPARPPEVSRSDSSESLTGRQLANRVLRAGSDAGEECVGGGDVLPAEFVRRLVRRIGGHRAVAVRRVCASADQASSPLHVFQASNLGPLGCRASCTAPRALDSRAVLPNRFGEPREGAEGGTRTRTARRPLAPQGFVRLPRPSVLFPSVSAPTSTESDAKASAQRPAILRLFVANWRPFYCIPHHWIWGNGPPWSCGGPVPAERASCRRNWQSGCEPVPRAHLQQT